LAEAVGVGEARVVEFVRTDAVGAGEGRAVVGEGRRRYWRSESGGEAVGKSSKNSRQRRAAARQARWSSDGRGKHAEKRRNGPQLPDLDEARRGGFYTQDQGRQNRYYTQSEIKRKGRRN
jgi:hypothetical protein